MVWYSGSLQPVAQATVGDGLSFDPFSFCPGWLARARSRRRRGEIVDACGSGCPSSEFLTTGWVK
jgi:hypothetical protein